MKRIISALLILMMLIPPMVLPAQAATSSQAESVVRVTTDKQVAAVGDTVTVTVEYENIPACSAVEFALAYDTEYLMQPADADVTSYLTGQQALNATATIDEKLSQDFAGWQAVKVVAANNDNCLMGASGTLFTAKFIVKKETPAPGIPLAFAGVFNNLYSEKDMRNTIQVVNTHIATANPTKSVTNVSLKNGPTKTQYVQGQALKLEGGLLNVTYNDGTTQEVPLSMAQVTQYDFTKLGTQTVKASYAGKEVSFDIETEASELSSISIGQKPETIEYILGKTSKLDKTGGVLLLHYNGSIIKTLDMTHSSVTASGYNPNQLGVQTIQVQYGGFQTQYKIVVLEKALKKIDVRTPMICDTCKKEQDSFELITAAGGKPSSMNFNKRLEYINNSANNVTCLEGCGGKTFSTKMKMVYFVNEPFDVENAALFVTYSDKTTAEIPMTLDMVEFNNSIATTQFVEVAYGEQWMLIENIRTKNKKATSVSISQTPDKTEYVQGQLFDPTGGKILVNYDDNSEEELSMGSSGVTFYYNNLNELGSHKITVYYMGQRASFNIRVVARAVASLAVDQNAKSTYIQGQELELSTKLNVTYNDGKTETAYLVNATVTGYNPNKVGEQLVTITYGKKTFEWLVTVVKKVATKLEVVGTLPTTILEGLDLNLENCTLTATYNDGEVKEQIAITPAMITGFNKNQLGSQTVTIAYEEGSVPFEIIVLKKSLTAIEVEGVKDLYLLGEELDRSVGKIKLIYDNGSSDYIDFNHADVSVEGFCSDAEGQYTITVGYQGLEDTYLVSIHLEIREISVTVPNKTEYKEGEPLNLEGGTVQVTYHNGQSTELDLSLGMISGYDPYQSGQQTLTVTLGDAKATFTVTVAAKVLERITVSPSVIDHNEWEELDLSQVVVTAWYDNNTSEPVTQKAETTVYDSYVIYTYEGKEAKVTINVIETAPTKIEWAEKPQKNTYVQGEALLKDGTIYVHYNDQTKSEPLSLTDENVVVKGDTETVGPKTIYVQYKDLSPISYEITVVPVMVEKVDLVQAPDQTDYLEEKPLNLAGGMILVTYNNKKSEPLAMDAMGVTISNYNPNQIGKQTVTVTYGGKSTTFEVNVSAKKAVSIKVTTLPKTSYLEGKDLALNLTGGKLTIKYNNDTEQVIALFAADKVSGFDKNRIGTQTITVKHLDLTTEFKITMNKKAMESIAITAMPTKTLYRQGVEKFDPAGGKLTVFYNNNTKEVLDLSAATISGFSNLFAGDVTLKVTYEGHSTELKVLILAENPFKDVKANEYYETPVLWAVTKGITTGTDKDSFSPDEDCTRGQIVTFLWRAAGKPMPKTTQNPFEDVKKGTYYYDAVLWAVENNITQGMDATHFEPDTTCTRGQVATFLWRAEKKPTPKTTTAFADIQKGAYYYDAVLWAVENKITNGMGDNKFAPDTTCTRGQIATFLFRANT